MKVIRLQSINHNNNRYNSKDKDNRHRTHRITTTRNRWVVCHMEELSVSFRLSSSPPVATSRIRKIQFQAIKIINYLSPLHHLSKCHIHAPNATIINCNSSRTREVLITMQVTVSNRYSHKPELIPSPVH